MFDAQLTHRKSADRAHGDAATGRARRHPASFRQHPLAAHHRPPASSAVPPLLPGPLDALGKPLSRHLHTTMALASGRDFSRVRVHTGEAAPASALDIPARVHTVGRDVLSAQRICGCGNVVIDGGECAACRANRLSLGGTADIMDAAAHTGVRLAGEPGRIPAGSEVARTLGAHLRVTRPDSAAEREADQAAERVTRMPDAGVPATRTQHRPAASGAGEPLSPGVRSYFEPRLGHDFSAVRVHTDTRAARLSRELGAAAFTHGRDIYFNERRFAPASPAGRALLAHELAHTIQQRATSPVLALQQLPPVPGGVLRPPGDCSWAVHRILQNEVDRACDRDTRCTNNDTACPMLWEKITFNAECIRARTVINARCFRGGNVGHIIALANAVAGLARCWAVYQRLCERPPVPVRAPERQPERQPVVDKSFMDKMAAITGLTGTALVIYLIVSEGTRLFPPRNLIPVP